MSETTVNIMPAGEEVRDHKRKDRVRLGEVLDVIWRRYWLADKPEKTALMVLRKDILALGEHR